MPIFRQTSWLEIGQSQSTSMSFIYTPRTAICSPKPHGLRKERSIPLKKIGILLFKQKEFMAGQAKPRDDFHKEETWPWQKVPIWKEKKEWEDLRGLKHSRRDFWRGKVWWCSSSQVKEEMERFNLEQLATFLPSYGYWSSQTPLYLPSTDQTSPQMPEDINT